MQRSSDRAKEAHDITKRGMEKWELGTLLQPARQLSLIILIFVQHLQLSGRGLFPFAPSGKLLVSLMDMHFKSSYA